METIRSASNRALRRIREVAAGRDAQAILLEGDRLVDEALRSGLDLELVCVAADRGERAAALEADGHPVSRVLPELLDRAGTLVRSPGVVAVARRPELPEASELPLGPRSLLVVASGIQDPGNLGNLARTAEAAGADGLVVVQGGCGPWNPKALRGSMGSLLRLPLAVAADGPQALRELSGRGWRQVRAATRGGVDHLRFDWGGPLALWLPSETGGLGVAEEELEAVTIRMAGGASGVESLNVTTAAAVLLFAAGRTVGRTVGQTGEER